MTRSRPAASSATAPPPGLERLRLPWWAWPPVLLMAGLLAVSVHLGIPALPAWLPYVVLLPLTALGLWRTGRMHVGVAPGPSGAPEVWAGPAHLPTRFVGRADAVRGEGKRLAMGPQLDPTAYVLHRPWIAAAVRLEVVDPDDPTPYWIVSTRRPEELLAAVRRTS